MALESAPVTDGRRMRSRGDGDTERIREAEAKIAELLAREGALENPLGVVEVQDTLLRRFEAKYEQFNQATRN